MKKKIVSSDITPKPLGPYYSQAVASAGPFLFVSGQVPLDSKRYIVGKGDIKAQTRKTLENLRSVLSAAGASLGDVVKLTVYLTDMKTREEVGEVRAEYFKTDPPASTLIEVKGLTHKDCMIEIEAIAVLRSCQSEGESDVEKSRLREGSSREIAH